MHFGLQCPVTVKMVRMHLCTVVETVENIEFRYYWELCVLIGYVRRYVDGWLGAPGVLGVLGVLGVVGVFGVLGVLCVLGVLGVLDVPGVPEGAWCA